MPGQTKREAGEKELVQLKNPPWQVRADRVCWDSRCWRFAVAVDSQHIAGIDLVADLN